MTERELQEENDRLRKDLDIKIAAIKWVMGDGDSDFGDNIPATGPYWWRKELRARAFPPAKEEFEEVEVKAWKCADCGCLFGNHAPKSCGYCAGNPPQFIELTGTRRIPKRPKVKRRKEIRPAIMSSDITIPDDARFFAEREEETA